MISPLHMTTIVRLTKHRQVVAGELQPFTFSWGGGAQKHPPPTPYGRLSCYVVFVLGTIEDCIRGVQNVDGVFKKGQRPPFIAIGRGDGTEKMDCPILVSPPTPPPPQKKTTFHFAPPPLLTQVKNNSQD